MKGCDKDGCKTAKASGRATKFKIRIHVNHINGYLDEFSLTPSQRTIALQNTISHELGHALGLNDNPTGAPSIMKYSNIIWSSYYPEPADVFGVHVYYK